MAIDTQGGERGDPVVPLLVGVFVAPAGVCFLGVTADSIADQPGDSRACLVAQVQRLGGCAETVLMT